MWSHHALHICTWTNEQRHRPWKLIKKSTIISNLTASFFLSQSVWILPAPPAAEKEPRNVQPALHRVHLPLQLLQQTQVLQQVPSNWEVGSCGDIISVSFDIFRDGTLKQYSMYCVTINARFICKVNSGIFFSFMDLFFLISMQWKGQILPERSPVPWEAFSDLPLHVRALHRRPALQHHQQDQPDRLRWACVWIGRYNQRQKPLVHRTTYLSSLNVFLSLVMTCMIKLTLALLHERVFYEY